MSLERLARGVGPELLSRRGSHHDHRSPDAGMKAASEVECVFPRSSSPRTGDVASGRETSEGRGLHADEHDRRVREKLTPVLEDEGNRELPLGDDEIDRSLTVFYAQELDQIILKLSSV